MTVLEPLIPISLVLTFGAVTILKGPFGRALIERMANRSAPSPALESELMQLRHELDDLRGQLVDTQERLDFAERMLAKGTDAPLRDVRN